MGEAGRVRRQVSYSQTISGSSQLATPSCTDRISDLLDLIG